MSLPLENLGGVAYSRLLALFTQDTRLLQVVFPADADNANALLPWSIAGEEAVCGGFRYRLRLLGTDVGLPLKALQGLPVAAQIGTARGDARTLCGIVTEVVQRGADGGFVVYEVVFEDALSILRLRRNWRAFQEKSALQIVATILSEHRQRNPVLASAFDWSHKALVHTYPVRGFSLQAGESDHDFICRLLAREGIGWFWAHALKDGVPQHRLVLFDHPAAYPRSPADTLRFHRAAAVEDRDSVTRWQSFRRLAPGSIERSSYDYKFPGVERSNEPSIARQGAGGDALAASLQDYRYDAPRHADGKEHYRQHGKRQILRHELLAKHFEGETTERALAAGARFNLVGHPEIDTHPVAEREFVVCRTELTARNSVALDAALLEVAQTRDDDASPLFQCRFTCVRADQRLLPSAAMEQAPTLGVLSAIVEGAPGREVDVDAQGRILVRFLFSRDSDRDPAALSAGVRRDSARLRVLQPWAEAGFGAAFWPRIGSEVLVGFIAGDADRPVVLGGLYNAARNPARFCREGSLPGNASLAGLRSRELGGAGYNQLRLDDSHGQISAQLASSHAGSELNLGQLTHPRVDGQAQPRGEGLELASTAAGAIRTASLLLSTDTRAPGSAHQLAREELLACLDAAQELTARLSELARQAAAEQADLSAQQQLNRSAHEWTAPEANGLVALSAAGGLALATPRSASLYTGESLDTTTQGDTLQSTGRRWLAHVGSAISWFVNGVADRASGVAQAIAVRLVAARGRILLQAQSDGITLEAETDIRLAANGKFEAAAADGLRLIELGGAQIEVAGGNIVLKCPGSFTVHAANFQFTGAAGATPELPRMPGKGEQRDWLALGLFNARSGAALAGHYLVRYANGIELAGDLDERGRARHATVPDQVISEVRYTLAPGAAEDRYAPHEALAT